MNLWRKFSGQRSCKILYVMTPWSKNILSYLFLSYILSCHDSLVKEKDRSIWPEYKRLRNRVTSELRRAVEGHYRSLIDENSNNPKEMWKTINKVLNKNQSSTTPRSVMYEGQLVEKQKEIAEAFNNHFTTIGPKLAEKIETKESDDPLKYVIDEGPSTAPRFEFHPVDPSTIEKEIKKLKCSKSAGYDKVSVKLVRDAAGILCRPLAAIFNSHLKWVFFLTCGK